MDIFHISPVYNRDSILRNGVLPSYVKHSGHREAFRKCNTSNEKDEASYNWISHRDNEKIIKDLIYAIVFIHPRNAFSEAGITIDYRNDHRQPIYKYNQMIFDVYKKTVPDDEYVEYTHMQCPSDYIYGTAHRMHEGFSHLDKELRMYKEPVKGFELLKEKGFYTYDEANKKFVIKVA